MGTREQEDQEVDLGNSARETAELAAELIKSGDADEYLSSLEVDDDPWQSTIEVEDGAEQEAEVDNAVETKPQAQTVRESVKGSEAEDLDLPAPARFTAEAKEAFNAAPPAIKREIAKMVKDYQAQETRKAWALNQQEREIQSVKEAMLPLAQELGARGLTLAQGLSALAANHMKLTREPYEWVRNFIRDNDLDPSKLFEGASPGNTSGVDIDNHPKFRALQEQTARLNNYIESIESDKTTSLRNQFLRDIDQLRESKDQAGRYLYPEMHDPTFFERAKPLVAAGDQTLPFKERLLRAYSYLTGKPYGSLNSQNPTELQPIHTKPRAQAVTVRGRSAPARSGIALPDLAEIPDDPRGTAELAARLIREGRA